MRRGPRSVRGTFGSALSVALTLCGSRAGAGDDATPGPLAVRRAEPAESSPPAPPLQPAPPPQLPQIPPPEPPAPRTADRPETADRTETTDRAEREDDGACGVWRGAKLDLSACRTPRPGTLSGGYVALDFGALSAKNDAAERTKIGAGFAFRLRVGLEFLDQFVTNLSVGGATPSDQQPFSEMVVECAGMTCGTHPFAADTPCE